MNKEISLTPCACGNEDVVLKRDAGGAYYVYCNACNSYGTAKESPADKESVVDAWNRLNPYETAETKRNVKVRYTDGRTSIITPVTSKAL